MGRWQSSTFGRVAAAIPSPGRDAPLVPTLVVWPLTESSDPRGPQLGRLQVYGEGQYCESPSVVFEVYQPSAILGARWLWLSTAESHDKLAAWQDHSYRTVDVWRAEEAPESRYCSSEPCGDASGSESDASGGASSASPSSGAEEPSLAMLARDWQSKLLGYIVAERPLTSVAAEELRVSSPTGSLQSAKKEPLDEADALEVWPAGLSVHDRCTPLGHLYIERHEGLRRVLLNVQGEGGCRTGAVLDPRSCRTSPWRLATPSGRRRVVWEDGQGKQVDTWDCDLLDAAREAASWLSKEHPTLQARLDEALLSLNARRPPPQQPGSDGPLCIALCTATMNRLWQLRRALPLNLLHCWSCREWAKIYVVDFNSSDGTLRFILKNCRAAMDVGLLEVFTTNRLPDWHASIAKNTAHLCVPEDMTILVNVDSDNLVGPDFVADVANRFAQGLRAVHYNAGAGTGTCGRIACLRADFEALGGYDQEDVYPMGAQDTDLWLRLQTLFGHATEVVRDRQLAQAIPNDLAMKVANCGKFGGGLTWTEMDRRNRNILRGRRRSGRLVRNTTARPGVIVVRAAL